MILRVPDYYPKFSCIADKCKDSCCIGWEIDIDEDTYEFYKHTDGVIGKRLKKHMYQTVDGDYSFELQQKGRCPFLNEKNLCDICIELGEEALSEVCTEYPRFTTSYGNVIQKCLSLSCEEVGRLVFTRDDSVKIVEFPYGGMMVDEEDRDSEIQEEKEDGEGGWENEDYEEIEAEMLRIQFLEQVQAQAITILQNKRQPIEERMREYLYFVEAVQQRINAEQWDVEDIEVIEYMEELVENDNIKGIARGVYPIEKEEFNRLEDDWKEDDLYQRFLRRFYVFSQMETLDSEWENVKKELKETLTSENYEALLYEFCNSQGYLEQDYEQLMVYFTFRYFMNAVYDYDLLSYARFALACTLMIRDMDLVRFQKNEGTYTREDRIDVVRIFSKEVEHSEENVELAREECMFDDVIYKVCSVRNVNVGWGGSE